MPNPYINFGIDLLPSTNLGFNLGSTQQKWNIFGDLTGNATNITGIAAIGNGGTGTDTAPTQGGIIYAYSTTAYASTAAGTTGQVLKSKGTSAPEWEDEYKVGLIRLGGS